jgi:hypothetical protein
VKGVLVSFFFLFFLGARFLCFWEGVGGGGKTRRAKEGQEKLTFVLVTTRPTSRREKYRSMLFSSFDAYPGTGAWIAARGSPRRFLGTKPAG